MNNEALILLNILESIEQRIKMMELTINNLTKDLSIIKDEKDKYFRLLEVVISYNINIIHEIQSLYLLNKVVLTKLLITNAEKSQNGELGHKIKELEDRFEKTLGSLEEVINKMNNEDEGGPYG